MRRILSRRAAAVLFVLGVIGAVAAVLLRPPARTPNIFIIVVDTLRADRLGVYDNPRGLSPFIDELASRGTVFANAYASSSWTCPSVASLLTSRYASQHQVNAFEAQLADEEVTLAEILAKRGYVGGGFSANFRLTESHGYAQGFRHWRGYVAPEGASKVRGSVLRRASQAWLRTLRASKTEAPLLLYLQYMETHAPYDPLEPWRGKFIRRADGVDEGAAHRKLISVGLGTKDLTSAEIDLLSSLYDGEVASVDAELRTFFADLERDGYLDDAIIVITSDHGEEFGEHNQMLHGTTLYNPAIRVPLIIVAPGIEGGRIVQDTVSLVDVAPTLLDLVGAPLPPTFEGRSLVPLMTGDTAAPRSGVLSELEPLHQERDWRIHAQAFMNGSRKLVLTPGGRPLSYDLAHDPGELRPGAVLPLSPGGSAKFLRSFEEMRAGLAERPAIAKARRPLDEATREKLRALGYQP